MAFLKPQTPIKDFNTGDYVYPLTTADQVVMKDGSRLNSVFKSTVKKDIILLANKWTDEAPYTQTITLDEYTDDLSVDANVKYSGILDSDKALNKTASCITYIKKDGKNIIFSCLENKPEIDIPMEIVGTCSNSIATVNVIDGIKPNFEIIKYSTEKELLADVPEENTIGVITDTEITSWIFSATEPEAPEDGMDGPVWIYNNLASIVTFNILKENAIHVYPVSAKQYISGAWVDKTAKSYQNGKWVDWIPAGALYWDGIDRTNFTGGWESLAVNIIDTVSSKKALTVENYNGYVKIYQANGGARGLYVTKNKIRINGYSSLKLSGEIYSFNGNPIVVALMTNKTKNGVIASYSFAQHGITKTFDDESIITLPSSGGEYYVGIGIASSDNKYIQIKNLYFE